MTILTIGSPRRIAIAAVAAALLGATALLALSAAPAAATYGRCDPGEFCLYSDTAQVEGIYQYAGSDPNLNNDHFERADRNQIVGNNTYSVWNRARPAAKEYVVIYASVGHRGADACVLPGDRGQVPRFWWKNIESYKWVTPGACFNAGVIPLD